MHPYLPYWLAAAHVPGLGPKRLINWLAPYLNIKDFFEASTEQWRYQGIPIAMQAYLREPDWRTIEIALAWAEQSNQTILCLEDPHYPLLLKEIASPPLILYIRGNETLLKQPQIAMVGSRHATPLGLQHAQQFSKILAQAGFVITSGLALGIDGASHRGALLAKGATLAVMGTGLHHIYPAAHQPLAEEIVETGGALVSEFALNATPQPSHFPRRNRIIAGLSVGVLIVEAALKSGSLITARYALDQGREVFAIPGSIQQPLARGCHYLIKEGAKLVEKAQDILEELGALTAACLLQQVPEPDPLRELDEKSRQVLEHIAYEKTALDMILCRSGLTVGEVSSILLTLELNGYILTIPGGYTRIVPTIEVDHH